MTVRRSDVALAFLALAAVAGLVFRPGTPQAPAQAKTAAAPRSEGHLRLRPYNAVPLPVPTDLGSCQARLVRLQSEISGLDRRIQRNLNVLEIFDRAPANSTLTAELGALLGQVLRGDGGADPGIDLRCRDRVCCAQSVHDAGLTRSLEPLYDVLRKQQRLVGGQSWRNRREACFRTRPTDDPPGAGDIVREAVTGLRQSGAIERCQQRFPQAGTLETRINVVADEGDLEDAPVGLSVRIGGKLAGTPLGDCISGELRKVLDSVQLPRDHESSVLFASFPNKPS